MDRTHFTRARVGARLLATAVVAASIVTVAPAQAQTGARPSRDELQAFPPAAAGQVRRVIRLPTERDEANLRVGIVVGRTMMVDCNRHVLPARIEERTAEGWGYTYYVVTSDGQTASTMMACPNTARTRQFVRAAEEPLVRYNSRLPLVIFAPTDVEVRTRIWRPGPETVAR